MLIKYNSPDIGHEVLNTRTLDTPRFSPAWFVAGGERQWLDSLWAPASCCPQSVTLLWASVQCRQLDKVPWLPLQDGLPLKNPSSRPCYPQNNCTFSTVRPVTRAQLTWRRPGVEFLCSLLPAPLVKAQGLSQRLHYWIIFLSSLFNLKLNPSRHWARGRVQPGQVGSPSQGHTETNETTTTLTLTPRVNLEPPVTLTCMFFDGGRKPEYPERTHL